MTSAMLRSAAKKFMTRGGFRYFRQNSPESRLIPRYNVATKNSNTKMASGGYVNYSNDSKLSWKRPEGPPRVWRVFEGRKPSEDGTIPRFTIQDVPEGMTEDVIDFMFEHLVDKEDICTALGITKDPLALEDMRTYWRNMMRQGISIVALTESLGPGIKPVIVGANVLTVVTAQDKAKSRSLDQFKSKPTKTFCGIVFGADDEADVLGKYGIDKYLGSLGLAAHSSFSGHGVGENILRAREDIGRAYQISVTEAMFTMTASQISASRAGFELQFQKEYSKLLDYEGNLVFPGATGKFIQVMTKRLY